ncbi:3-hydroxyacyl-CoA dehydrogenase NAD-binding domain-containing protein [Solirubrobacter soli]|uniref:3-hydroxyacyl-CoA dehydrogenase NAD-binding domain-containing protein n=1 Tax=Solirubrobacter soli TaxID=363832 RepID=UPI00040AF489|nr:3-hydroxyacyl-CoA dehydrogenase NAD-binding domain-containing protein [Solirubrobacter soli]
MRVAIVGGGSIGVGWAVVFSRAGHEVHVHEPDAARREAVPREVATVHADLEAALDGAEHVQECTPEDETLKRELFERLTELTQDIPLASSSSAITASRFAPGNPRALVAHPGNPPYLLPVVELVPAPFTDPAIVDRVEETMRAVGMSPVRIHKEIEGFVFNRLQGAVLREAYCLVRDGVASVDDIDRVMREGLGRRWAVIGPFETADLNTRGGIAEHAKRLGPAYARMGAERGQDDPWTPELVEQVVNERRRLLPLEEWEDRVAWRDRQLLERSSR